ncbi:MAG: O-antigen ligase family protein [Planctomycetota bacterium]
MSAPSPIAAWNVAIDALPLSDVRSIGRTLIWIGATAILVGMFMTPPWVNIGLALGVVGAVMTRAPLLSLPVVGWGAAFAGWLALTVIVGALRKQAYADQVPGVVHAWLCLPIVAAAAVSVQWRGIAVRVLIVAAIAAAIVGVLQFTIGLGTGFLRIDPNGTEHFTVSRGFSALHLTFGFAGALLAALSAQPHAAMGLSTAWAWVGRGVALVVLGICGARSAVLGGAAGIVAALATRGRSWLIIAGITAVALVGLVLGRMALTDSGRLHNMFAGTDGRWAIWATSAAMVKEHPFVGMGGREAYKLAYNATYERVAPGPPNEFGNTEGCAHAHNWLLALAAEHGLPAVVLHLALIGAVLVTCWRHRRESPAGWGTAAAVTTTALIAGVFEPYPTQAVPGAAFHACLGVALGLAYAGRTDDAGAHAKAA